MGSTSKCSGARRALRKKELFSDKDLLFLFLSKAEYDSNTEATDQPPVPRGDLAAGNCRRLGALFDIDTCVWRHFLFGSVRELRQCRAAQEELALEKITIISLFLGIASAVFGVGRLTDQFNERKRRLAAEQNANSLSPSRAADFFAESPLLGA